MKKSISKFLLCSLILVANSLSWAQNATITHGDPFPMSRETIHQYTQNHIEINGRVINTMVDLKNNEFTFQIFDQPNYNLKTKKVVTDTTNNMNYEYFRRVGDKVYLFYSIYHKGTNTENLLVKEVDTENGGFMGKGKLILKLNDKLNGDLMSLNGALTAQNKFKMSSSSYSNFSIFSDYKPEVKKNSNSILKSHFISYDSNFNKNIDLDYSIPFLESEYTINERSMDSQGIGYVSIKKFKSNNGKIDQDNFSIIIYKIDAQGLKEIGTIDPKNIHLRDFRVNIDDENEISVTGFYSNTNDKEKSDGIFHATYLDNVFEISTTEFGLDFIIQNENKDNRKKSSFENLRILYSTRLDNGEYLVSGYLREFSASKSSNSAGQIFIGNIVVFKLNENGELIWKRKLARNKNNLPFNVTQSKDYINFLYYDKKENSSLKDEEMAQTFDEHYKLALHKISLENGDLEYIEAPMGIQNCGDQELKHYTPYVFFELSEDKYLIQHQVKKFNYMWFTLSF